MGAAMTNSMFAQPGAAVVYLAGRGWLEPYYWDLATVCGHDYRCIFGDTEGEGAPWKLPFRIDAATLGAVLDELDAR